MSSLEVRSEVPGGICHTKQELVGMLGVSGISALCLQKCGFDIPVDTNGVLEECPHHREAAEEILAIYNGVEAPENPLQAA